MLVMPAVDVSDGRLARLDSGQRTPLEAFGGDPLEAARSFLAAGAEWVHVVDMDHAFSGDVSDLSFLSRIADLGMKVQASGGIATVEAIGARIDAGATRVVLGSGALGDRAMVEEAVGTFGEILAVGLETEGEVIVPRGRGVSIRLALRETLEWLRTTGASRLVSTQVRAAGSLSGPDLATLRGIRAVAPGIPVTVSGGISTTSDIGALVREGADGAIVGRALYEGRLDLRDAIAAGRST